MASAVEQGSMITLVLAAVGSVIGSGKWASNVNAHLAQVDTRLDDREVSDTKLSTMLTARLDRMEDKLDRLVER